MNKEEFLELITKIPKTETENCISSFDSVNVEDLANAVERFNKIPNYNDLLKENQQLKEQLKKLKWKIRRIKKCLKMYENKDEIIVGCICDDISKLIKDIE